MDTKNIPPDDDNEPEPILKKWTPDATTIQLINGAARDLADLVSLLIARQRVAVGFEADHNTIHEVRQLSRSLRELTQIIHQTELTHQAKKRGRPRKQRLVHPELMDKYEKQPKHFDAQNTENTSLTKQLKPIKSGQNTETKEFTSKRIK